MDLKKPLNLDLKLSLNKDIFSGEKMPLIVVGSGLILSCLLIFLIVGQYGNFGKFSEAQNRHQQVISNKATLEKDIKSLISKSPDYFNNLASAPKNNNVSHVHV